MSPFKRILLATALLFAVPLTSCKDITGPITPPVDTPGVNFTIVAISDTTVKIRVSWNAVQDANGAADGYFHTMVSTYPVTDSTTGPLPSDKFTTWLSDTVSIRIAMVNDTATLTSSVWSTRRGMRSLTPGMGSLFVQRGDAPPPPPDSVRVDTLVIGMVFGGPNMTYAMGPSAIGPNGGPWKDTLRFSRLYALAPPKEYLDSTDTVFPPYVTGGQWVASSWTNPRVTWRPKDTTIIELVEGPQSGVFRVLNDNFRTTYIIVEYQGMLDSMKIVTSPHGFCGPWPDCYYNPIIVAEPELPRVYITIPPCCAVYSVARPTYLLG